MGLAPELESRLQEAHFEVFVPVLALLGVEAISDLEFVQESDFDNFRDITTGQKLQFCIWKNQVLEDESKRSPTIQPEQDESKRSPTIQPEQDHSNPDKTSTCPQNSGLAPYTTPETSDPCDMQLPDLTLDADFDKIFGNPSLSTDDVKSLYRDLCKKHHPDKGGNGELFARMTQAYNFAVDPSEYYLNLQATNASKKREENHEAGDTTEKSFKSGEISIIGSFLPKGRGFRASVKLCCTSIARRA